MNPARDLSERLELFESSSAGEASARAFAFASCANAPSNPRALHSFGSSRQMLDEAGLLRHCQAVQLCYAPVGEALPAGLAGISSEEILAGCVGAALGDIHLWPPGKAELENGKQAPGRPQDLASMELLR